MNRPEENLQKAVAQFLDLALLPDVVWWHPPNGGARSRAEAGKFKAMGVRAGAPDINIFHASKAYFIELKAPKGSTSKAQKTMHERLIEAGCPVAVCKSIPEVEGALAAWDIPTRVVS